MRLHCEKKDTNYPRVTFCRVRYLLLLYCDFVTLRYVPEKDMTDYSKMYAMGEN